MKLGNRIRRIRSVDPEAMTVTLEFADGFRGTVHLAPVFRKHGRGSLPLEIQRGQLFGRCFVEGGALAWPNDYELCPDAVRAWIREQRRRRAA